MITIEEAAIELSKSEYEDFYSEDNLDVEITIKDLKAGVEFAQRWIPVEEELPEVGVIVQIKFKELHDENIYYGHDNVIQSTCDFKMFNCEQHLLNVISWRPIEYK